MTAGAPWADGWISDAPARLARLREQVGAGLPSPGLDRTEASLVPVWSSARRQFTHRAPGAPVDPTALPAWFTDPRAWRPRWWDDRTVWLADGLMGYLAETLLHHTPGARWGVAHDEQDPEAYVHEGQPVLVGLAQPDVHLWTGMAIAAGRVWEETDDDHDLARLFAHWTGRAGT